MRLRASLLPTDRRTDHRSMHRSRIGARTKQIACAMLFANNANNHRTQPSRSQVVLFKFP